MYRLTLVAAWVLLLPSFTAYSIPPRGIPSVSEIDTMIRQCFQTLCKEWMSECHWYCDSVRDKKRCKDCLSWRGQQCMDCFEL
ncbi:hypothetical protein V3C99_015778 [Haemonchus contortus]